MNITPVILCGGSGTRLWPISRKNFPKQFLNQVGDSTLFQQSLRRVIALENKDFKIDEILIITNENHRFLVLEQINNMNLTVPTRILLEPESKNTAPALTLGALAADEKNPESILVVTPADQYVKDLNKFTETMHLAIKAVIDKAILILGINPTRPETGFGYIHYEGDDLIKNVLSFKEKPDIDTAQKFISQGQYSWNGGMFILRSKAWLDAIQLSNAEIYKSVRNAWQSKKADQWFERPDEELFKQSPSNSIDYAVMEKAKDQGVNVKLVLLNAGWSDLGSFDALDDIEEKDENSNIFKGDVVSLNTKNTIAITSKKNISLLGVKNLIVIEAEDSILVANKSDAQSIKQLVKILEKNHKNLLDEHARVNRPWGWFETLEEGDSFKVKRLQIDPGKSISLQRHQQRSEHWVVVKGVATITKDDEKFKLTENQSTYIEKKQIHQITNHSEQLLQIIEVQSGKYLGEDDIQRLEDNYGR